MKKWLFRGILLIIVLLIIAVSVFILNEYREFNTPWGDENSTFAHQIEEGQSARQIAHMLKQKGVISNETVFLIIADFRGISDKLQAGEYEFDGTKTPYEILDMLAIGWAKRHRLVIPEGFTQVDIANRCEEMEICPKDELMQFFQSDVVFGGVVAKAPGGAAAGSEGTFFPDTYLFTKNTPTHKVFNRMRNRFKEKWSALHKEIEDQEITGLWWQKDELLPREQALQVLTLASIIEKEAKRDEDRPIIASVFVNRLKSNMPLQSDATIHYFIDNWSRSLTRDDLQTDSPYNTYKNTGLPPAPICNPGEKSMRAALQPADTDYLFFMSLDDGSMVFNKTHRDHVNLKNKLKREKNQE